MQRYFIYRA